MHNRVRFGLKYVADAFLAPANLCAGAGEVFMFFFNPRSKMAIQANDLR